MTHIPDKLIELLESYLAVASSIGAANVTLERVAKHARVSFSKVQYHFGGQGQDIVSVAALYVGQNAERFVTLKMEETIKNKKNTNFIEAYVSSNFLWAEKFSTHAAFWMYYLYTTSINTELKKASSNFMEKGRKRIHSLILQAVGHGAFPKLVEIEILASKIQSVIIGGLIAAATDPQKSSSPKYCANAIASIEDIIKGHVSR